VITQVAAVIFAVVAFGVIGFQIALALGAPWGRFAMGGAFPGRFPPPLRIAALVQALVVAALAIVVLSAAGLVASDLVVRFPWLPWIPVAFSGLALILNGISRSPGERRVWVPVTLVMLVSSLVVAFGG
jgi:hypothetical protein